MRRVILLGATGFLGSSIAKKLYLLDYKVLCIIRESSQLSRLDSILSHLEFLTVGEAGFDKKIKSFNADIIINTACLYQGNDVDISQLVYANLIFPLKIMESFGEKRVVWINTSTSLSKDVNFYALSKWQFCEWGREMAKKSDFMFFNVVPEMFYGFGESNHRFLSFVMNSMMERDRLPLTEGFQRRDIIYIDDLVDAYIVICELISNGNAPAFLDQNNSGGYLDISVGTGYAPSIRDIAELIKEETKSTIILDYGAVEVRKSEPRICIADTTILKNIGWEAKHTWREGIVKMLNERAAK